MWIKIKRQSSGQLPNIRHCGQWFRYFLQQQCLKSKLSEKKNCIWYHFTDCYLSFIKAILPTKGQHAKVPTTKNCLFYNKPRQRIFGETSRTTGCNCNQLINSHPTKFYDFSIEALIAVNALRIGTHVTKGLWAHDWNLEIIIFTKIIFRFNINDDINPVGSQFCTCHYSSAVVTCAKLWPDLIIIFHVRAICFNEIWVMSL